MPLKSWAFQHLPVYGTHAHLHSHMQAYGLKLTLTVPIIIVLGTLVDLIIKPLRELRFLIKHLG